MAAPVSVAARADRAVLVSVDGMGGQRLASLLAQPGRLPSRGLARLVESGFYAERSIPATPSLTSTAHATHVTGALPRDTGIVGNWILDRTQPFGTKRSGFDAPLRADTLCEAARRQGKRVGVIAYPHAAGSPPSGCAGFGMNWTTALTHARIVRFPATAWRRSHALAPPGSKTFSPPESAAVDLAPEHPLRMVALDTTDDGRIDYDRVWIEPEVGAARSVGAGEWFAFEVRGKTGRAGAWCRLLSIAPDLSSVEVYLGEISETDAYPPEFRRAIDERAGFWPGRADAGAFGPGSDRTDAFREQSDRLTEFFSAVAVLAAERTDWDLLFVYFSEVDAVEHRFLLTDSRQEGFTPQRSQRFGDLIDRAYAAADDAVARLESALTPRDAIFVTSDHGMTPLWAEVYPDELLREAGLLKLAADGTIDPASSVVAIASGGVAHVYANPAADADVIEPARRALDGLRVRGEPVWDRVVRRAEAGELGLDAPESGDLIFLAKPGIAVSMSMSAGRASGPAEEYGGHGYRAAYRDLDATFLAAGPGIARGRAAEIASQTIAARVAEVLGIQPPRQAAPAR